jgi:predicted RNase H-like nuclease (RuvC/YqgF family)
MCITIKEVEEVFDRKSRSITDGILEKIPAIINSVSLTMQHKTAPETQRQLDESRDRLDKNDRDHQRLMELVEAVAEGQKGLVESQKQHSKSFEKYEKLLISIDEGVKAKGWIKRKLKEHWPAISIFTATSITIIGYAISGWIMLEINKK